MNDLYEARNSIYCYPNTNILVNKFNIKNIEKLREIETDIVVYKSFELRQAGITGNFDVEHVVSIHRYLFSELYTFAGLFRNENIAKDDFRFAEWEYIDSQLEELLNKLKNENYLEGLSKEKLANRLAYYLAELNVLHPFREGNGRTLREFIRQLALKNGYLLNFQRINPKDMLNACIKSVVDTTDLEKILYECLENDI